MKTNKVRINMEKQFALDYNCEAGDFSNTDTLVTAWQHREGARRFGEENTFFSMLSWRGKLVITAAPEIRDWCSGVLAAHVSAQWGFELGSLISIDNKLREYGYRLDSAHLAFIQKKDMEEEPAADIGGENGVTCRVLYPDDIAEFEDDERIDEAFLFEDYLEDVLGVAVEDRAGELKAVAGATNNGAYMWQMGINSFDEGHGYASMAVKRLIAELNRLSRVPYYDTALSHIASQKVALRAGMEPAFCEVRAVKMD